jgi:hypothetical protein
MFDGDKSNIYWMETLNAKIVKGIKEKNIV